MDLLKTMVSGGLCGIYMLNEQTIGQIEDDDTYDFANVYDNDPEDIDDSSASESPLSFAQTKCKYYEPTKL